MLQLADVFEEFREVSKRIYDLDPSYYISAPQLSWDAMLKITRDKIELISDSAIVYNDRFGYSVRRLDDYYSIRQGK